MMDPQQQMLLQLEQQLQFRWAQAAEQLSQTLVTGGAAGIEVTATGTKFVGTIKVTEDLRSLELDELQDIMRIAVNDALEKADVISRAVMQQAFSDLISQYAAPDPAAEGEVE
jgi:DNA-binding protein YbaB